MRSLNNVRKYLDSKFTGSDELKPEARLSRQIVDLELIKASMKISGEINTAIYNAIDICIEGYIWIYRNGGAHDKLPDIIDTDISAKQYYEHIAANWDILQEYMRTHMNLMEI